jgi:hypothetical protein
MRALPRCSRSQLVRLENFVRSVEVNGAGTVERPRRTVQDLWHDEAFAASKHSVTSALDSPHVLSRAADHGAVSRTGGRLRRDGLQGPQRAIGRSSPDPRPHREHQRRPVRGARAPDGRGPLGTRAATRPDAAGSRRSSPTARPASSRCTRCSLTRRAVNRAAATSRSSSSIPTGTRPRLPLGRRHQLERRSLGHPAPPPARPPAHHRHHRTRTRPRQPRPGGRLPGGHGHRGTSRRSCTRARR